MVDRDLTQLSSFLALNPKTVRQHIKKLVKLGWIRKNPENDWHYQLISRYKITRYLSDYGPKSLLVSTLSDTDVLGFTWKTVAQFRAKLVEPEIEQYLRYKKTKDRVEAGQYGSVRPKEVRATRMSRTKTHGRKLGDQRTFIACSLAADLTNISKATAWRYRQKNKDVVYTYERFCLGPIAGDDLHDWNEHLALTWQKDNQTPGRYYAHQGMAYFNGTSVRGSHVGLKRVRMNWRPTTRVSEDTGSTGPP